MSSLNRISLIGNLGQDPERRSFQNGGSIVTFTLATSESWTDKNSGERRDNTTWHNVVVRNEKLADLAEKYLRKGSKVFLEGQIQGRKYTDRDGNERYVTEVVLPPFKSEMVLLDRKEGAPSNGAARPQPSSTREQRPLDADLNEDQIPF